MGLLIYMCTFFVFLAEEEKRIAAYNRNGGIYFLKHGGKFPPLGILVLVRVYVKCPDAFGKSEELIW